MSSTSDITNLPTEWVRLPKPKDRLYGLSRTTLLELCESGAVRSVTLRKRHAMRGIRLMYLPSLLAYFDRNASGGIPEGCV